MTLDQPLLRFDDGNTWSAKSLAQVKDWLVSCQQNHGSQAHQCPIDTGSFQPTRVLDVGSDDESPMVHLCDTDSLPNHDSNIVQRYVTLSHCWGGTLEKKLVQESMNDFRRCIPFIDLPQTFQDTIHVTRKLGVKYLWIDALRIVQDSRNDWLAESSIMGE